MGCIISRQGDEGDPPALLRIIDDQPEVVQLIASAGKALSGISRCDGICCLSNSGMVLYTDGDIPLRRVWCSEIVWEEEHTLCLPLKPNNSKQALVVFRMRIKKGPIPTTTIAIVHDRGQYGATDAFASIKYSPTEMQMVPYSKSISDLERVLISHYWQLIRNDFCAVLGGVPNDALAICDVSTPQWNIVWSTCHWSSLFPPALTAIWSIFEKPSVLPGQSMAKGLCYTVNVHMLSDSRNLYTLGVEALVNGQILIPGTDLRVQEERATAAAPYFICKLVAIVTSTELGSRKDDDSIRNREVEVGSVLGKGGYGTVYRATWCNRAVALKIVKGAEEPATAFNMFDTDYKLTTATKEASIGLKLSHPNVVKSYDWWRCVAAGVQRLWIIMELCEGGSLRVAIERGAYKVDGQPNIRKVVSTLTNIAQGMVYLHAVNIIHSDLSASNILLDKDGVAKIADFGHSHILESSDAVHSWTVGTYPYMSPERLFNGLISTKSEVYAFGIILYELYVGAFAWEGLTRTQLLNSKLVGTRLPFPRFTPPEIQELFDDCTHENAKIRPTFVHILHRLRAFMDPNSSPVVRHNKPHDFPVLQPVPLAKPGFI